MPKPNPGGPFRIPDNNGGMTDIRNHRAEEATHWRDPVAA
jgi:hypothetical protein